LQRKVFLELGRWGLVLAICNLNEADEKTFNRVAVAGGDL
jgi:hypothetical protein